MIETEPQYFKDFREHIDKKFCEVDKRFDKIDETLESHSDQIGEVKVGVTKIEMLLAKKASYDHVKDLEHRTEKLEKAVFA